MTVTVEWAVPASLAGELRAAVADAGGAVTGTEVFVPPADEEEDYTEAAFEPLTVVVCTVAAGYLADKIAALVRDTRHGGAIVDLHGSGLQVRSNPAIPGRQVLVVDHDGVRQLAEPAPAQLRKLIDGVVP